MRRQGSLRLQSSGDRFLWRRLEYALLGHPMPAGGDPVRAHRRALAAGCAVALGIGVLATAFPIPPGGPGQSPLVMSRQSGALFVRVGDRLRPVANLVSAQLILGTPATPRLVDDAALRTVARGPVLGIPGAPHSVGTMLSPAEQHWTVCDRADGSTAITVTAHIGPPTLQPGTAVVVSAAHGDGSVYLLYDGRRARIDVGNPATARALHLEGVRPRPVSATLLNVLPEAPAIGPPPIIGSPAEVAGVRVGGVLRTARADAEEFYVVVPQGIQRIGRLTADLIRFADPMAGTDIPFVPPDVIATATMVDSLDVGGYPDAAPRLLDPHDAGVCATWRQGTTRVATGAVEPDATAVPLAVADGDGPNLDAFSIAPGSGVDVEAATATAGRYVVTDAGVVFPVRDSTAAAAIGLGRQPTPIPWAILAALPAGPELSKQAALAGRDVIGGTVP
ncbi:type VII secretion protein EccB [Mycolicibacterium anyangense]|uniref:type VII secretion protein EccB n=1 Tax=Mycolicibacterium anyangense TaxID=1431246 RepID=UPI0013D6DE07|nr:type VII secretion protein EccB [Mycolicibacterium anyangense]